MLIDEYILLTHNLRQLNNSHDSQIFFLFAMFLFFFPTAGQQMGLLFFPVFSIAFFAVSADRARVLSFFPVTVGRQLAAATQ